MKRTQEKEKLIIMTNNSSAPVFEGNAVMKTCYIFELEFGISESFSSKLNYENQIALCVFNTLSAVLTFFLNLTTIMTFLSSKQLQAKVCFFLVFVQSISNMGISALATPLYSATIVGSLLDIGCCNIHFAFFLTFFIGFLISVATFSAMNIERYLSILHAVYHRNKVTKKRLLIYIICFSSLFLSISAGSIQISRKFFIFSFALVLALHFTSTFFMYTKVYFFAMSRLKQKEDTKSELKNVKLQPQNGDINGPVGQDKSKYSQERRIGQAIEPSELKSSRAKSKKELLIKLKLAKSCFIVVGCSFASLLLPVILQLLSTQLSPTDQMIVVSWGTSVHLMASSLDSLVFFWGNKILREEALKMLKSLCFCSLSSAR